MERGIMPIRGRAFRGPTQNMTLTQPFFTYDSPLNRGVPLGIDVDSKKLVMFDPWQLKQDKLIHSTQGCLIGDKSWGKSATLKILDLRLCMLAAGFSDMRDAMNDHKVEGDRMEYSRMSDLKGAVEFMMAKMGVNPFDHRLCPLLSNLISMATLLASFAAPGGIVHHNDRLSLRVAVFKMFCMRKELWSPGILLWAIRTMDDADVELYHEQAENMLRQEHRARMKRLKDAGLDPEDLRAVQKEFSELVNRPVTVDGSRIIQNADNVFALLDDIFNGDDAGLFGDSSTLYDMYSQPTVNKIWSGMTPRGEAIMRSLDSMITIYAIENRNLALVPHINLDDEKFISMSNIVNARTTAYKSKIARSVYTCDLAACQRLGDLRHGEQGSQHWNYGQSVINDFGFLMMSRQPNDPVILAELQARARLNNRMRDRLTRMPRYCFMVKLSDEIPVTTVRIFATPNELQVIPSDAATDSVLHRPDLANAEDLEYYAAINGVTYLGEAA